MFFLGSSSILFALVFVIAVLGMAAIYLLRGTIGLVGATCTGFARVYGFLKRLVLGQKDETCLSATDSIKLMAFLLVVYIAVLVLVARIS